MKTVTKEMQDNMTPDCALELLIEGNARFVSNLKVNRNLLQQVNETRQNQHPFALIISCMDSRTSAELIFDQGLGDIFSVRVAGNVINDDILASAEFGCKIIGAKIVVVLGHTGCGAIKGSIDDVDLGHLHSITRKVQRCIPPLKEAKVCGDELVSQVTKENVLLGMADIRSRSSLLAQMELAGEIKIVGGIYDVSKGVVDFFEDGKKSITKNDSNFTNINF